MKVPDTIATVLCKGKQIVIDCNVANLTLSADPTHCRGDILTVAAALGQLKRWLCRPIRIKRMMLFEEAQKSLLARRVECKIYADRIQPIPEFSSTSS